MIWFRMVSVTLEPTAIEPLNSMTAAIPIACFIVNDREDTDVAKELATSLAPMRCDLVRLVFDHKFEIAK